MVTIVCDVTRYEVYFPRDHPIEYYRLYRKDALRFSDICDKMTILTVPIKVQNIHGLGSTDTIGPFRLYISFILSIINNNIKY